MLWDATNGRRIRTFKGHTFWVGSVAFSPDAKRLVSGSLDSTARIWDSATGELRATLIGTRGLDWLAITPEGFFSASSGGGKLLGVVRGLDGFSVDQFYPALYRPELVREKLAGDPNSNVRNSAAKLDLSKLLDSGRKPPNFEILSSPDNRHASDSRAQIHIKLEANADPVYDIEAFVNGRQTTSPVFRNATARMAAISASERSVEVPLEQGENQIRIVARNKVGQTSREFVIVRDVPGLLEKNGTLYVLAIGVDKYDQLPKICGPFGNQSCNLRFAGRDARSFRDVMVKHVGPLYGTRRSTVIPWHTFQGALQGAQGRRLMFADTCHSGRAYNARLVNDAANANIVIFSAMDAETLSWEFENLAHGVFTYALLEGLEGKARRADGTVSVLALSLYISEEVSRLTQEKQQPTFHMAEMKNFTLSKQ
jgi:WD domain, G-beta repeat/Caspase domain